MTFVSYGGHPHLGILVDVISVVVVVVVIKYISRGVL
jgi:hypothetical protein